MRLARRGINRDHGPKVLFNEDDSFCFPDSWYDVEEQITVDITAKRTGQSSYYYELFLSPEDVLKCFFCLPVEVISKTVQKLGKEKSLEGRLPEIIQHLLKGVFEAIEDRTS